MKLKKGVVMKDLRKKLFRSIMSGLMIFSLVLPSNVFATNPSSVDANDFPKTETLKYHGKISYDGSTVGDFTIDGKQAFCLEHPKTTPGNNTKLTTDIYNNVNVRKVLYYGWEGSEQWSGFKNNKNYGVVATSLLLSHYYYGDEIGSTTEDFYNYIKNKSVPDFSVEFSKSSVNAYKEGNIQRTETLSLVSKSDLFGLTIKLDNNMTYVDETHNKKQTGGSVEIKGKTKFHFEAPLNVKMNTWTSGNKVSKYSFQPIVSKPASSSLQDIGRGQYVKDPSEITSLTVNWLQQGSLKLAKQDNKGQMVPNTSFKLSYNADMSSAIGTYTTGNDGTVTVNNLMPQTVYIQETNVPDHLVLDNTVKSIEIKTGEMVDFTQTNNWKQGYIEVTKKDKKTSQTVKKAGIKFEVLSGNQVIATITTNVEGKAKTGLIDYGTYTIREKEAPQNYVIATLTQNQGVTENGKTYSVEVYNEPVLGQIELQKQDSETGNAAQGDATLKDAEYVIKANENILNPADGTVLYAKDEVISQKTVGNGVWGDTGTKKTDSNAKITWSNLPMGSYRVEETKPSNGYFIDKNTYTVTLSSTDSTQQVVTKSAVSKEQVIKGKLEVAKMGSDGTSGIVQGLAGVEFTMKLYSDVQKNGWDKAKTYDVLVTD